MTPFESDSSQFNQIQSDYSQIELNRVDNVLSFELTLRELDKNACIQTNQDSRDSVKCEHWLCVSREICGSG